MSHPAYGRVHVPEPPHNLACLHFHDGTPLKEADHETPLAVMDQSDLIQQGIHTSKFIPGCKTDAEALGSCVPNTGIEAMAAELPEAEFIKQCRALIPNEHVVTPPDYSHAPAAERCAIGAYHDVTFTTGNPAEEWPVEDCGSSGVALFQWMQSRGIFGSQKVATPGESLISLMQGKYVLRGSPFFYAWEEPAPDGFIDGDGSREALETAIASGLAGGHEMGVVAIEKLTLTATGAIVPEQTIIRERNHWGAWGDNGCCRSHLSTWIMLGGNCDYRAYYV